MTSNPTLGSKLAAVLDELEAANIKKIEDQAAADMAKIRKERADLVEFMDLVKQEIVFSIEGGRVPLVKVSNYDQKEWVMAAHRKNDAAHIDVWKDFINWARSNALTTHVEDAHDGVGERSWINIMVKPVRPGTRDMSLKEMEGLGVGDYRG